MLANWFPLLRDLRQYRKEWLSSDLIAGLSVAAVQIPTAMAYADLAGLPPQVGLYASILPVMVYALFASSRQLIVGPDAATCAMIAALLMPIAQGNPVYYLQLMAGLTITTGLLMVIGGSTRMGFFVNFFSRPVLVGYLNGIAISIIAGQLGKILGIQITHRDFGPALLELFRHLEQTHLLSLGLGAMTLVLLVLVQRYAPRAPAALIALAVAGAVAWGLDIAPHGVALVGAMPSSLPSFALPGLGYHGVQAIFMDAVALLVVSFSSGMLTARSFAARNGYSINADQEMRAIGFANIISGLSGGFAVTGADSRTAVNNASGGKTQLVSLVAALATAAVILFLTAPLGYLPITALGAVLVISAWGLLDIVSWKELFRISRFEFGLSLLTTVGVLTIGVLPGVVLAILLAIVHVLKKIYQPQEAILGQVPGLDGYNDIALSPEARTIPGVVIYRFESPLLFFNADLFKSRLHALAEQSGAPHTLVLSLEGITQMDVTGLQALFDAHDELKRKGIRLLLARPKRYMRKYARTAHAVDKIGQENIFFSIRSAVKSALATAPLAEPPASPKDQPVA
ncbi:MAG TPA: SulP family inorganic anion transporter [Methylophilaceae bacterium]|nr:SulP family inorganic anion transporter [Methylophilaceae bacterium]